MVGPRVKLSRPLQGFIVVLIITSTDETLDRVDFVIIVARSFTPEIITVVVTPIPPFSVVASIIAPKVAVVKTSAVVSGIVSSRRLLILLGYSDIFSDEFFCVVGVGIIFGRGEELGDYAWPLVQ
jgi:hypothetical protein